MCVCASGFVFWCAQRLEDWRTFFCLSGSGWRQGDVWSVILLKHKFYLWPVTKALYHSGCHDKPNCLWIFSPWLTLIYSLSLNLLLSVRLCTLKPHLTSFIFLFISLLHMFLGPFHIRNLFRNKTFEIKLCEIFLLKLSTFTLEINFRKPYVNNIVDTSFDVCKHWPIDQSQRSISEISSEKFDKIEHVRNCKIEFRNLFFFESWLFAPEIFLRKLLIYINFKDNFKINFQREMGLMLSASSNQVLHTSLIFGSCTFCAAAPTVWNCFPYSLHSYSNLSSIILEHKLFKAAFNTLWHTLVCPI